MTRKNYGYGSYFENGKFYDENGNEIKDIKAFYSAQKKKSAKTSSKTVPKKYGYGGDGSYERNGYSVKNISNKKEFPDNL